MINRNMRTYTCFVLESVDIYGQRTRTAGILRYVKMAINLISQSTADNMRYKDATYVGLTYDKSINDKYEIEYNGRTLKVLYTNPYGRMVQVFMAEK